MKREIKFRAWIKHPNGDMKAKGVMGYDAQKWAGFDDACRSDDFVIMQYTGLNDKNGKEIFEGDLLILNGDKDCMFEVFYNNEGAFGCGRHHYLGNRCGGYTPTLNSKGLEVIGNVFENSDLFKEEKK